MTTSKFKQFDPISEFSRWETGFLEEVFDIINNDFEEEDLDETLKARLSGTRERIMGNRLDTILYCSVCNKIMTTGDVDTHKKSTEHINKLNESPVSD